MKKYLLILSLSLISTLSFGQYGVGVFAGAHGGLYSPHLPNYHQIYKTDIIPVGFQAGVGYDWFYAVGKFRSFSATGEPETFFSFPANAMQAEIEQSMSYFGVRLYDIRDYINFYAEVGYCIIQTDEMITTDNPTYQSLEQSSSFKSTGLGFTIGVEKPLFKYVAIDAQLEWTRVPHEGANSGIAGESPKVGGVLIGLGLNVRISK